MIIACKQAMYRFLILFHFYRNFIPAVIIIDWTGVVLTRASQSISYGLIFTMVKILTNLLIGLLFHMFRRDSLYYYNNLGYSTISIYCSVMGFDLGLWILMMFCFLPL